ILTLDEAFGHEAAFRRPDRHMPANFPLGPCDWNHHYQFRWALVEKIHGEDQGRPGASLFASDDGIEVEIPNLAAKGFRHVQSLASPSAAVSSQNSLSRSSCFHALAFLFSAAKSALAARKKRSRR